MTKYLSLILFLLLSSGKAHAQDSLKVDSIHTLKELLVVYQAGKTTPVTFQDIRSATLEAKSTGQEPSFLLSETPSVTVHSDAGNTQGYSYFRLRGIDQTRINLTLDGVPLNEPEDQGAYFSNYPDLLNSISKIQIQRGVGTSKNGVAGYGGSIQLFSPDLYAGAKTTVGVGYGSFRSMRAFAEYQSGVQKGRALYARGSQVSSDGYKYNSSNNSQSVFVSSGWFLDRSSWKLNLLAGRQRNRLAWLGVSDSLIAEDRRTNANFGEKDRFTQALAQLQNHWQSGGFSSVQSSIYYTYLKGDYDFNLNSFLGLPGTDELYNYAFRSNLAGFFSNYTFTKNNFYWTAGVHANRYDRRHTGSEKTLGVLYKNTGYKNEASVFSKAGYTVRAVSFLADVQYRYASFDYRGGAPLPKMGWHFINPKAGVTWQTDAHSTLYYSIGSTGREPTRNDLFGGNDDLPVDSSGQAVLSVKTPEYVVDQELGFRHQSEKLECSVNLYYMDFRNEIVLDGKFGPNGLALTNKVEQSFRTGLEWSVAWAVIPHFTLVHNASYNYSRIREQEVEFSPILTPPFIVNQEVVYLLNNFSAALSARYQDRSFMDFANTAALESYFLFNGRMEFVLKNVQVGLFVNNISNSKYFSNGYVDFEGSRKYFVQAPTNFYASVKYNFTAGKN